jgi:hypothetical protein
MKMGEQSWPDAKARANLSRGISDNAIYRMVERALQQRIRKRSDLLIDVGCGMGGLWNALALWPRSHMAGLFYFTALILLLVDAESRLDRAMQWRWLRVLGRVSYGVYLLHMLAYGLS